MSSRENIKSDLSSTYIRCTYEIYINSKAIPSYKLKLLCSNHKMTSDVPTD